MVREGRVGGKKGWLDGRERGGRELKGIEEEEVVKSMDERLGKKIK